jgi:hypothetical protein
MYVEWEIKYFVRVAGKKERKDINGHRDETAEMLFTTRRKEMK